MKLFYCEIIEQDGAIGSYISLNYSIPTVTMRFNRQHCLVLTSDSSPIELIGDSNVTAIDMFQSTGISDFFKSRIPAIFDISVNKIPQEISQKDLIQRTLKRPSVGFNLDMAEAYINAGKGLWVDLVTEEMDI